MGWMNKENQVKNEGNAEEAEASGLIEIEVKLQGGTDWININKHQVKRIYRDDLGGALLLILDEVAELLTMTGVRSEAGKEEDALRSECISLIQSITQLGRSAGIHMVLATQRNDAKIIPGVIQNNCQFRMACGKLGQVASMMALGNTLGTTIKSTPPGSGAISAIGKIDMIQYYFETHSWIEEWYSKRGLNKKGFDLNAKEDNFDTDEVLEGIEEIETVREVVDIEFAGVEGSVDKTRDQNFEEI